MIDLCQDTECIYLGQPTARSCRCYTSTEERQRNRIEALEAALREIEHECWHVFPEEGSLLKRLFSIARAALAPEQNK